MRRVGSAPVLLALLLSNACGADAGPSLARSREGIFAGTPVPAGEWEGVVALQFCSGVLVARNLALYAAHCGTDFEDVLIGNDVTAPRRVVPITECRAHPDAALGNGRDVAFCVLAEPLTDVPVLNVIANHEAELVRVGTELTQLGFGPESESGAFGVKRAGTAEVQALGDDLVVAGTDTGTCAGDSGGPALVRREELDASLDPGWRVLGVLSAGTSFDCEVSVDHYTNLRAVADWIESESGVSLAPGDEPPPASETEGATPAASCQLAGERQSNGALGSVVAFAFALFGRRRRRSRTDAARRACAPARAQ